MIWIFVFQLWPLMSVNHLVLKLEIGSKDKSQNFFLFKYFFHCLYPQEIYRHFQRMDVFDVEIDFDFFFRFHVRMSQLQDMALFLKQRFYFWKRSRESKDFCNFFSKKKKMDHSASQEHRSERIVSAWGGLNNRNRFRAIN